MKTDHILVWSEVHGDKSITIGFTKKCIDEMLPECFHVMQADASNVREKGPMLVLETNDGLESIKSPFTGKISYFNSKARNYPDKLTTEDTILTILPPGVEGKPKVKLAEVQMNRYNIQEALGMPGPRFEELFGGQAQPAVQPADDLGAQVVAARREAERNADRAQLQANFERQQAARRQRDAERRFRRANPPQ